MEVELLLAADCPNAAAARVVLATCLDRLGLDLRVRERVGGYRRRPFWSTASTS